jgi:NAD(P)-dependent dehydrogenase (short-subunit alcohol dehydrogenase family)
MARRQTRNRHRTALFVAVGLALARAFAREGCRLVLCAPDEQELDRAREDVARQGAAGQPAGAVSRALSRYDKQPAAGRQPAVAGFKRPRYYGQYEG